MILVLGGTYDSRKLTEALLEQGRAVLYSSVTAYNTTSLPESTLLEFNIGPLKKNEMESLMRSKKVTACVDATHPYAKEVSINAIEVCQKMDIPYVRLERPRLKVDGKNILGFPGYKEAVDFLKGTKGKILLTTGSRQLEFYSTLPKERLIVRVLPTSPVLAKCEGLGYKPNSIIAMQGPFSYNMNIELISAFGIRYLVTKDSGEVGGVDEKLRAAADTDVQIILIERPEVDYPVVFNTVGGVVGWLWKRHDV